MKVLVAIKRVVDYAVKARVLPDKSGNIHSKCTVILTFKQSILTGVELNNVKMSINPFCEIAIEQAVRFKEQKIVSEVIGVSIGGKGCQESLRTALAIGIDKAIHVPTDIRTDQYVQPLSVAKILKAIASKESVEIVILGKQSIDGDNCQTGQMLAALLNWSQCTFASSIVHIPDKVCIIYLHGFHVH